MASNTENLNLLMKNPSTDGADTFNVQTMLNENWQKIDNNAGTVAKTLANILKPTTPPLIGLPPSTTPDGMFQALWNTGELHVWRKTVKNAEDIPAGYTLSEVQNVTKYPITDVRSGGYTIVTKAYSNLSVDDAGNVSLDESSYVNFYDDASAVRGKFIRVNSDGDILFIPNDANISTDYKTVGSAVIHNHYTDKYQIVTGYPLTPAGTTTTYPVSTNPNAYQEGDDAKEAGYTLGDATSMKIISYVGSSGWYVRFYTADSVTVSTDGVPSITQDENSAPMITKSSNGSELKGKYIKYHSSYGANTELVEGTIYFVPSDAVFTKSNELLTCDKVQLVTGYAAIPAGTTIEYLGRLGDKARVQVLSYVGTGTYGSSNPNSLTFDFVPKAVFLFSADTYNKCFVAYGDTTGFVFDSDATTVLHVSWNGKNISWFNTDNDLRQHNVSGYKYRAIAIG